MTSVLTGGNGHRGEAPPNRFDRAMLAGAGFIVRWHKAVILGWLMVIVGATPFALKMPDVLNQQGASKVVAGTESATAERLATAAFPQRSSRQVFVVVTASNVYDPAVRRFLADLDRRIAERIDTGEFVATVSPYTVYRDITVAYLRQAHTALRRQAARQAPAPGTLAAVWPAVIDGAIRAGQLPGELRALLTRLGPELPDNLAGEAGRFAAATNWLRFPIAVPPETVRSLISRDGDASLVAVTFADRHGPDPDVSWLRETARAGAGQFGNGTGGPITVHVTGELPLIADTYERAEADNTVMEVAAYLVIGVVLLLFFRAIVPAVLTMVLVGAATNVSQAALWVLGHHVSLTQFTVTIMTFVMLGAGVDYSMLLSSRYRQQRVAGLPAREAIVKATASAGESVLLASAAVIIAFGVALLSPVEWVPPLGYGGLVGIPIIFLAVLTLTPSLIALLGDRFFALGHRPISDLENEGGLARQLRRLSAVSQHHRRSVTVLFLLATIPFAWITATASLSADPVALSADTDSRDGSEVVTREWGKSEAFPTFVVGRADSAVADGPRLQPAGYERVQDLAEQLAAVPGVQRVDAITQPFGRNWSPADVGAMPADLRRDFLSDEGVLRLVVVLRDDPYSDSARRAVDQVRSTVDRSPLGDLAVGGSTLVDDQYGKALSRSFWQLVLLVSVAVSLVLVVALRSIAIPLQLVATIMISNVWAVGVTALVFDRLRGEALINDLPVFLVILMMGLGMDYEIFLVTRIRELVREGAGDEESVARAVVDTGRVIAAAGLVMAGSLGAMMLSSTLMLQQYGLGLGTAVLLDATLIRMLLVPALLLLLRRYNWWMPRLRPWRRRPRTATA
ncbi:MMPL family transporter [Jidongwangia harbinensis]|uniref:MMPL family transporter n=1 Tax=Jidongwangia harbinensis TaxID=2878561 RepID=UPI001CD9BCCF|nr:MMPL family transporter [Jidongwangia harbinensis]MCA2211388.1 MMPL family transporter [Jidongwangia harbinensis]